MKKILLAASLLLSGFTGASAYWLATPVVTSETVEDNKVTINWTYDDSENDCSYFQVVVYKMHVATAAERFVLAENNFDYIASKGTMTKHEERGAAADFVEGCPGWWVKTPVYMNGAMGIDTFFNFTGSDNSDIFAGAYMVSPDYDLSNIADPKIIVEANLANEATSVSGGFYLYAWNTNWFDANNYDYKPVYGNEFEYTDLFNNSWTAKTETLKFPSEADYSKPEELEEIRAIDKTRTRVLFYGSGYSAYWINDFKVSVDLAAGDKVDFGASIHKVEGNSFTIDTSADTPTDYVYAYEVRAVKAEYDDYREMTTIRAVDHSHLYPRHIIGQPSGIENVVSPENNVTIVARDGQIVINGAETAVIYNIAGQCVYNGTAAEPVELGNGVYIVKAGNRTAKVIL